MRVAALYDIHGNLPALEAVAAELQSVAPDVVLVGGDVVLGPFPRETLELLDGLGDSVELIRGNTDRILVEPRIDPTGPSPWPERQAWVRAQLTEEQLRRFAGLSDTSVLAVEGLGDVLFCHGSPRSDEECVTVETPPERVAEFTAGVEAGCVVTAHTHMQYDRRVGETRLLNPGSVGLPYEPEPGFAYWALLGPGVELRRTPYDLEIAVDRLRAGGMPSFERIEELMRTPPPQAEVIEHAERVVFAG
jgi:putative phosphoesterase